jgi:hypothetical protein
MTAEELVVGSGVAALVALAVWRFVLQVRLVKLFVRRITGGRK